MCQRNVPSILSYISRTTLAHGSIGKGQNTIEITVIIIDYSNFCECIVFLPAVFLSYRLILKYLFHTIINFFFWACIFCRGQSEVDSIASVDTIFNSFQSKGTGLCWSSLD
jgi:hypothetical protein